MTRLLSSVLPLALLPALVPPLLPAAPGGILPAAKDGRPLNLDFEDGTLRDWTASGRAFERQPIRGDTVSTRRGDMKSRHQGQYWIGTFEISGDAPQGVLTSVPFKVTQPFATFLVAGGPHETTRVELVRADTQKAFFKVHGHETEDLQPVLVDLKEHLGKEIFIRVVDEQDGHWGHINFDDFRLHAEKPTLENALDLSANPPPDAPPPADVVKFAGLSGEDAVKEATLPAGFTMKLFAAEPDVKQPIAFALDDRGRVWVAEAYTYPIRAPDGEGKDRILIFEDSDGDGKFDKQTVFIEKLNLVSGLEVGFGGVWVGAAPYLYFIPDRNHDDRPDGPPEVLLDGWAYQDTHETLNTFTWGPDGWLYGCHGVFTHSKVGKPGASDAERTRINAAVWRFHPTRQTFEIFSEGTSNPWGIDFDAEGQCFIEACVIPHLFHMIQGARYERQGGQHFNPYTFDDLKTIADHVHWAGSKGPHAANSRSDQAGGGHAHAGLLVYQGGAWPEEYRGKIFMNNIHGQRINMDIPERRGSGFVGHHGADFVNFNDRWSQVLNLLSDQDGSVYMIDWYDKNQCHHQDPQGHDRSNGRIFKLVHSKTTWTPVDLASRSDEDLARLVLHPNEFHVRHARRLLEERAAGKGVSAAALEVLRTILREHADPSRRLRALWALHVVGQAGEDLLLGLLKNAPEYVRAWAVQFLYETKKPSDAALRETARLAREDASPVVRLYAACALQRTPPEKRWDGVAALLARAEDANDHNLPLMAWYAAEPLVALDLDRALSLALEAKLPEILGFAVRRAAAIDTPEARAAIARALQKAAGDARQIEALRGLALALRGRRGVPMPEGWAEVEAKFAASPSSDVRVLAQSISVTFGSAAALSRLMAALVDRAEAPDVRRTALESLLGAREPKLPAALQGLLDDPVLRRQAIRALAAFDDPATPAALLAAYKSLDPTEKRDALSTLASRVAFAGPLLEAVGAGAISAKDLTADTVRQLRSFKVPGIDAAVEKVWGAYREPTADRKKEIERYRQIYAAGGSQPGDASRGRAVFTRICQQCHVLFDAGGKIGPDLTGSNRNDLEYILQNMVDPNAVIPNDYRAWTLAMKDGRVLTGLLRMQDAQLVTLATAGETVVVPRGDIETLEESEASMMPDNLLAPLTEVEVRDLIYYLGRPGQVPLIATRENLGLFFNGKDLTGWDGDPEVWRVEGGEIVGSSAKGLARNSFLKNQLVLGDFRLVCEVKLRPNAENSGIQFRSAPLPDGEVRGCQADAGKGWWGKLYEEQGRALLWDRSGEAHVKPDEWNTYEVLAVGSRIRTAINGKLCVDLDDPAGAKEGIIALQAHAGGPLEVRFRNFRLEIDPEFRLSTGP